MDFGRIRCDAATPQVACLPRLDAVRRGIFWYSDAARGWLWSTSLTFPDAWQQCPWCGGTLPSVASAVQRLLEQADGEGPEC